MEIELNVKRCKLCKQLGHEISDCPVRHILLKYKPKVTDHIEGSSPPEIFVGSWNWPNVYFGFLAPNEYGNTEIYSKPEIWCINNFSIEEILSFRVRMIYSRKIGNIKKINERDLANIQEIGMAKENVDIEAKLKKPPSFKPINNLYWPIIGFPAEFENLKIQNNPKIPFKVEKVFNDYDLSAVDAIIQLYKEKFMISDLIRFFSIGCLGKKKNRKLVPTRWAVTAVDDIISKWLIKKIKGYDLINEFRVFHYEYLGNHYEIIFIPYIWHFEVIEAKIPGCIWNKRCSLFMAIDYESYHGRKNYASNVTGAYYANRLAVAEYLEKIKKQAAVIVLREVKPSYYAACGVGILREICRKAFNKSPEIFYSLEEALNKVSERLELDINKFIKHSWLIKKFKTQTNLKNFEIK